MEQGVRDLVLLVFQSGILIFTYLVYRNIKNYTDHGATWWDAFVLVLTQPVGAMAVVAIVCYIAFQWFFPSVEQDMPEWASRSTTGRNIVGIFTDPYEHLPLLGLLASDAEPVAGRPVTDEIVTRGNSGSGNAASSTSFSGEIPEGPQLGRQLLEDEQARIDGWRVWAQRNGFPNLLPPGGQSFTDWIPVGYSCVMSENGVNWLPVDEDNFDFSCPGLGINVDEGVGFGGFPKGQFSGTGGWPDEAYQTVVIGPTQAVLMVDTEIRNAPDGFVMGTVVSGTRIAVWQRVGAYCRNSPDSESPQWFLCANARVQ